MPTSRPQPHVRLFSSSIFLMIRRTAMVAFVLIWILGALLFCVVDVWCRCWEYARYAIRAVVTKNIAGDRSICIRSRRCRAVCSELIIVKLATYLNYQVWHAVAFVSRWCHYVLWHIVCLLSVHQNAQSVVLFRCIDIQSSSLYSRICSQFCQSAGIQWSEVSSNLLPVPVFEFTVYHALWCR